MPRFVKLNKLPPLDKAPKNLLEMNAPPPPLPLGDLLEDYGICWLVRATIAKQVNSHDSNCYTTDEAGCHGKCTTQNVFTIFQNSINKVIKK